MIRVQKVLKRTFKFQPHCYELFKPHLIFNANSLTRGNDVLVWVKVIIMLQSTDIKYFLWTYCLCIFPLCNETPCTAASSIRRDEDNIPMENILSVNYLICGVTFSALFRFWSLGLQVPEEQWRRAYSGKQPEFPGWEGLPWKGLWFGGCTELLLFTGKQVFSWLWLWEALLQDCSVLQ